MLSPKMGYQKGVIENSGKLVVTLKIVAESLLRNDKVIIFSQSLFVLDLLQQTLCTELGYVPSCVWLCFGFLLTESCPSRAFMSSGEKCCDRHAFQT